MRFEYDSSKEKKDRATWSNGEKTFPVVAFKLQMVFEDGQIFDITRPSGGYTMRTINKVLADFKTDNPKENPMHAENSYSKADNDFSQALNEGDGSYRP